MYNCGRLGMILTGTLRLYETFTAGSRLAGEPEQLCRLAGMRELLRGLKEYEARQMIQKVLGRIVQSTIKQVLRQTGNSIRQLAKLLERLRKPKEINRDSDLGELFSPAGDSEIVLRG